MAAEKRGIYFGRMLNLLVSTFRPRTERDFPSNNPQPIGITAFPRRIYFGRACQKVLISCEIRTFSALLCLISYFPFFLTQTLTPTGADSGKHYTAPERMLPIVFAASRLAEVVT